MVEQWICGRSMRIHVMSQVCHHPEGLACVTDRTSEVKNHIVDFVKLIKSDFGNLDENKGLF